LDGRVVAGLYEYQLFQGGASNSGDGNWYLRNTLLPVDPENPEPPAPIYRPEPFAYLGNQTAANGMFQHTLHDRLGEPNYAERTRGDERNTNGWARVQGTQLDTRTAKQIGADIDTWMVQGGVELGRWSAGDSRFHLGGMVGTGRSTTRVDSEITGHKAIGRVQGNSLGVYGTWYANAAEPTGLYVDSWLQYGRYDNEVNGDYQVKESYKSSNLAFSLEAGYAWQLRDNGRSALFLEPQAQAIFSDYSSDRFTETSGMEVRAGNSAEVLTRLGARLYGHTTNAQHKKVQPFLEANWWHAAQEASMRFDGQELDRALPRDRYEVKVGAELELGSGWTGWGHLGYQQGEQDYQSLDGLIGIKRVW
jgi:autotransporter family porin